MPGATSNGLPYPLGSEPFADGADAIQALAEALDPPWGIFSRTTDQTIPANGSIGCQYGEAGDGSTFTSHFSLEDDGFYGPNSRIVYTGPERWFIVSFTPVYPHDPEVGGYQLGDRYGVIVETSYGGTLGGITQWGTGVTATGLFVLASGEYLVSSVATKQADDTQAIRPVFKIRGLV